MKIFNGARVIRLSLSIFLLLWCSHYTEIEKRKPNQQHDFFNRKDEHPPSRKQSLPSPVISPPVNQPPASSAPSHHAPLQQDGAPPRVKKEPPPVPVKTYHLRDRGIEPDDLKIRNYENSNRYQTYAPHSWRLGSSGLYYWTL